MMKVILTIFFLFITLVFLSQNWGSLTIGYNDWHLNNDDIDTEIEKKYTTQGYPSFQIGAQLSSKVSANSEVAIGLSYFQSNHITINHFYNWSTDSYNRDNRIQDFNSFNLFLQYGITFERVKKIRLLIGFGSMLDFRVRQEYYNIRLKYDAIGQLQNMGSNKYRLDYNGLVLRNSLLQIGAKLKLLSKRFIVLNGVYSIQLGSDPLRHVPIHQIKLQFEFHKDRETKNHDIKITKYKVRMIKESYIRYIDISKPALDLDKLIELSFNRNVIVNRLDLGIGVGSFYEEGTYPRNSSIFGSLKTSVLLGNVFLDNDLMVNRRKKPLSDPTHSVFSVHRFGVIRNLESIEIKMFITWVQDYLISSGKFYIFPEIGAGLSLGIKI